MLFVSIVDLVEERLEALIFCVEDSSEFGEGDCAWAIKVGSLAGALLVVAHSGVGWAAVVDAEG